MSINAQGAASIQAVLDAQVENVPGVVSRLRFCLAKLQFVD